MKILITGGCGFVGSNLAIYFKDNHIGAQINSLDNLSRKGSEINCTRLKKYKIKNMKLFMNDQGNNKFRREFGKFKMMKEKGKMDTGDTSKAEKFAEEVKQELESQKPSGLMTKETE